MGRTVSVAEAVGPSRDRHSGEVWAAAEEPLFSSGVAQPLLLTGECAEQQGGGNGGGE